MLCRNGLVRVAALLVPLGALTACPQLLSNDFAVLRAAGGSGGTGAADPAEPDASVAAASGAGGRGGSSGASGSAGAPPDAGSSDDAGISEPPNEIQVALHDALAHRYRFDANATLLDSVSGENAEAVGATFSNGAAVLAGGMNPGQYIDLPNGILSGLVNASFEVWVIWDVTDPTATSAQWQRIFDLGRNPTTSEGEQCVLDADATALYLTPRNQSGKLQLSCETCSGTAGTALQSTGLPTGVPLQLVVVVDDAANLLSMYRDGELVTSVAFTGALSQITNCTGRTPPCDWNNWLGRSQHSEDPGFVGRILDFRIYKAALRAEWIRASFSAGADADW